MSYDANTGRFIEQDPMGFVAGDVDLYRYVGNGPTNATDPSGFGSGGVFGPGTVTVDPGCGTIPPTQILVLPEKGPPFVPLPPPGTSVPADGLALPTGIMKIPNNVDITIRPNPGGGYAYHVQPSRFPYVVYPTWYPAGYHNPFNINNPLTPVVEGPKSPEIPWWWINRPNQPIFVGSR